LQYCTCTTEFVDAFAKMFPSIINLSIYYLSKLDETDIRLELLESVLSFGGLQKIRVGNLNWTRNDWKGKFQAFFKIWTGVTIQSGTCLILSKPQELRNAPKWKVNVYDADGLGWEHEDRMTKEIVYCYKLDSFFKDFRSNMYKGEAWITFSYFNITFYNDEDGD
jgi:hypothetical protein